MRGKTVNILENMHTCTQTKCANQKECHILFFTFWDVLGWAGSPDIGGRLSEFVRKDSFLGVKVDGGWAAFPLSSASQWLKLVFNLFRLLQFNIFYHVLVYDIAFWDSYFQQLCKMKHSPTQFWYLENSPHVHTHNPGF